MTLSSFRIPGIRALLPLALTLALAPLGQSANVRVLMTVDNSYALFYGSSTAATNFVASDFDWTSTETHNFTLPGTQYLYIVTASDLSVAQGFLGQFENLDTGEKLYSQDPQWEVTATGLGAGAPYSGSAANLMLLTTEIGKANSNLNPSGGWVGLTAGPNNGGGPWGTRPGIDAAAKWVWYSSNGDLDPTTPGFDHDEWLIFRIQVGATAVPEPSSFALAGVALACLALARKMAR